MFSRLMGFYDKVNSEMIADGEKECFSILEENNIKQAKSEIAFLVKSEIISMEDIIADAQTLPFFSDKKVVEKLVLLHYNETCKSTSRGN